MKNLFLALGFVAFMSSCGSSAEVEAPTTIDTVKVECPSANADTTIAVVDSTKK